MEDDLEIRLLSMSSARAFNFTVNFKTKRSVDTLVSSEKRFRTYSTMVKTSSRAFWFPLELTVELLFEGPSNIQLNWTNRIPGIATGIPNANSSRKVTNQMDNVSATDHLY